MSFDFTLVPTTTLFAMMLAMGMTLRGEDFARVVKAPWPVGFGLLCQIILLPVLAFLIAWLLSLPREVAIGLVLIAACPGGVTSNALTHYARGGDALSISLTALSSGLAWLSVPLVVGFGLAAFGTPDTAIALSPIETVATLFSTTALPVGLGMLCLHFRPEFAKRLSRPLLLVSTVLLMLLVVGLGFSLTRSEQDVSGMFGRSLLAVLLLLGAMTGVGHAGARLLRLPDAQRRTVLVEVGIQNFNLAIVLALNVLAEPKYLGPALVYLPVMLVFALVLIITTRTERISKVSAGYGL
jgi:BASS family bile acid:Na+ symporter